MDTLNRYRQLVKQAILAHTTVPYSHGDIALEPIFDRERDRYVLMLVGRDKRTRVHGCLIHVDIIEGKIWIQRDGTEKGIAAELVEAGVPKDHIVLGFRSPAMRRLSEFAAA